MYTQVQKFAFHIFKVSHHQNLTIKFQLPFAKMVSMCVCVCVCKCVVASTIPFTALPTTSLPRKNSRHSLGAGSCFMCVYHKFRIIIKSAKIINEIVKYKILPNESIRIGPFSLPGNMHSGKWFKSNHAK